MRATWRSTTCRLSANAAAAVLIASACASPRPVCDAAATEKLGDGAGALRTIAASPPDPALRLRLTFGECVASHQVFLDTDGDRLTGMWTYQSPVSAAAGTCWSTRRAFSTGTVEGRTAGGGPRSAHVVFASGLQGPSHPSHGGASALIAAVRASAPAYRAAAAAGVDVYGFTNASYSAAPDHATNLFIPR